MTTSAKTDRLAISNALIFDGFSVDLVEGSIQIVEGTIVEIGDSPPQSVRTIDARGAVVIPGLIDAHFHAYGIDLNLIRGDATPLSYVALMAAHRLKASLHRGFTTVRDVGGGDAGLDRAVASGLIPSPRYFFTGGALSQTGGHGDPRPPDLDMSSGWHHMTEVVDGVDALRVAVRDRFRRGVHAIKIMTSGGVASLADPIRQPQYSAEEVRVVVEEAHRRGSYVAAHAYSPEAIVHSVANGVRTVEHGNLLDLESAALMAESGAYLVPTLVAYDSMDRRGEEIQMAQISREKNRQVLDAGRQALEIARAAGVKIGFGTDLIGELEDEQLLGLRLQSEVDGVLEVLRSSTSVNAEILGQPDIGRIAVGAAADLIVLDGNPFEDAPALWRQNESRTVIKAGNII